MSDTASVCNPFADDELRHGIWEMLVRRDIEAFAAMKWADHERDFLSDGFVGIDASDPASWKVRFPTLASYAEHWQRAAEEAGRTRWAEDLKAAHFRVSSLRDISVEGDAAVARKVFDGTIRRADGTAVQMKWVTNYFLRRRDETWLISGFVGYLPAHQ